MLGAITVAVIIDSDGMGNWISGPPGVGVTVTEMEGGSVAGVFFEMDMTDVSWAGESVNGDGRTEDGS